MTSPYLSELRIFSFGIVPRGWAQCNGQLLPISQNQALFALLGTAYGGNGVNNFALPDLQGRVPMHRNFDFPMGPGGGEQMHTLTLDEIPAHAHIAQTSSSIPDGYAPDNNFWVNEPGYAPYGTTKDSAMSAPALSFAGRGFAHDNMAPYLVLNICIAVVGIFPQLNNQL